MNDDQGRSENSGVRGGTVLLVQYSREADHFVGVEEAVMRGGAGARGVRVTEQNADVIAQEVARAGERGDGVVIVVKDTESPLAQYAMRARDAARRVRVALMMDGIVEYRNTFVNPWVAEGFLHAMPVDAVFAAVEEDAAQLRSWGNHAVATGLPRLSEIARSRACTDRARDKVMVATARRAAFSDEEFVTLRGALERVRDALIDEIGEERIVWRLTEGLDGLLGVVNDTRGLSEAIGECGVVITTPSTLMLEARLMGARVAILHPWETPLWQRFSWVVRRGDEAEVRAVLRPSEREEQEEAMAVVGMTDAAERVADEILRLLEVHSEVSVKSVGKVHARTTREHVGVGARVTPSVQSRGAHGCKQVRVVNLLSIDGSPVGGVTSWALRLAREMPNVRREYDVRTLAVVSSPEALWGRGFDLNPDGTTEFCHLHPLMDAHERVERVCESLRAMAPEIVLQNYADHCAMAAMIVRAESQGRVRVINIAHTDVGYYRELAERYNQYDSAIGVSPSCMAWLNELRDGRPTDEIVYGVPVSDCPREVSPTEPLRICYVGRMVEEQKRIGLLWRVVDGLEMDPGTDADLPLYELHLIGDGPELATFAKHAAMRTLRRGRIVLHGRQGMEQVESLVRGMDVSILVSSYEGTSVTMLEAMGQGVVPCVTRVNSGVDRWVRDGVNGIVVGVDEVNAMGARLRVLAHNRSLLAEMGRAAWERIRGDERQPGSSLAEMARAYAGAFDRVRAVKSYGGGTPGCFMRPMDAWRWQKTWSDDPAGCADWCERILLSTGCTRVLRDPSDAVLAGLASRGSERVGVVLTDARECSMDVGVLDDLRSRGVAVAVSPMLAQDGVTARLLRGIEGLRAEGCARIAVYGTGHHTRRCRAAFVGGDAPIVGFIDDQAKPGGRTECFGLPVVRLEEVEKRLGIDGIILSSDAFEARMWARCEGIRERGVRVASLYGAGSTIVAGV